MSIRARRLIAVSLSLMLISVTIISIEGPASAGSVIARVSLDAAGAEVTGVSEDPDISGDGNLVVFASQSADLVPGDTNGRQDVFVKDLASGTVTRVSVDSAGNEANGDSSSPVISADGTTVAFVSSATDLTTDTNGVDDIFVHTISSGVTELISVSTAGSQTSRESAQPSISADGMAVAFRAFDGSLVAGDTNTLQDVFLRDRSTSTTIRVSVDSSGNQAVSAADPSGSQRPSISDDGNRISYWSSATNLVTGDTNAAHDIFLYQVDTAVTTRLSTNSATEGDGNSFSPDISGDGTVVSFYSRASNLASGDTNGVADVFVTEVGSGTLELVSINNATPADGQSVSPVLSSDGSVVVYITEADNLTADSSPAGLDVLAYHRSSGLTQLVSKAGAGNGGNGSSNNAAVSSDGTMTTFQTDASDLVADDMNAATDIYVSAITELASPTLIDQSFAVDEDAVIGTSVGAVSASDPDDDILVFSVTGGTGEGLFTVDPSTGDIATAAPLSGLGALTLNVDVTDGTLTSSAVMTITISSANEAPTTSDVNASTSESTTVGTIITTVIGTDPDGDTLTYTATSGSGLSMFAVDAVSGNISVATPLVVGTFDLVVNVSDGALSVDAAASMTVTSDAVNTFDDDDGNIFEADIEWLASEGITRGCGVRLYCPQRDITRGEMATFFARALDLPAARQDYFDDDDANLFEADINRLAKAGITFGCGNGNYCPTRLLTRGEAAAFVARALDLPPTSVDYFLDDDGTLFEGEINRIAEAGITVGCAADQYCPADNLTRGQVAAFLRRAFG